MARKNKTVKIAYVPVVHRGYLQFFNSAEGRNYLLPFSLVEGFEHLARDVRALRPEEVQLELSVHGIPAAILTRDDIDEIADDPDASLVLPNEDIAHALLKQGFPGRSAEFRTTFLRWDRMAAFSKGIPEEGRVVRFSELSQDLQKALPEARAVAERSPDWWRQIGAAVIPKEGPTLFAYNRPLPHEYVPYIDGDPRGNFNAGEHIEISNVPHSEIALIAEAAKRGIPLKGAIVYVLAFPCAGCAYGLSLIEPMSVYFSEGYSNLNGERALREKGVELIRVVDE